MKSVAFPAGFPVVAPALPAAQYAAQQLSAYFERMDGSPHPVLKRASGFAVTLTQAQGEPLADGAFHLVVEEGGARLLSSSPGGFVYGAYALLERAGCRFLAMDCEVIPQKAIALKPENTTEAPAFPVREVYWREALDGATAAKLRVNTSRADIAPHQGGKAMFYNFSHTFNDLVPVEKWFDTHPEYFSMVEGRRLKEKTQLCLTNPEVLKLCVKGVRQWIHDHPEYDIFSVAMNDWYNHCQCPDCSAVDAQEESASGTMIRFVNAIAQDLEEDFPHVKIHTFAYLYCRKPPRHVKPHRNVIVRLCSIECCFAHPIEACGCQISGVDVQSGLSASFSGNRTDRSSFMADLEGWAAICQNLHIWDYTTNYANYLQPFPNLSVLQPNIRMFRRMGVQGVLEQGNFSLGRLSALGPLKIYLLAKLLWNPEEDFARLMEEFAQGYWGPAKDTMLRYVETVQHKEDAHHASIYDMPDAPYLSDRHLEQAQALLARAKAEASMAPYLQRIQREELSVRYTLLARQAPETPGRDAAIDAFARDARSLGISELFERKDFDSSVQALKSSRYTRDRSGTVSISYPL